MLIERLIIYQYLGNKMRDGGEIATTKHRTAQHSMTNDPDKVWPGEIVPYQIDLSVGKGPQSRETLSITITLSNDNMWIFVYTENSIPTICMKNIFLKLEWPITKYCAHAMLKGCWYNSGTHEQCSTVEANHMHECTCTYISYDHINAKL